MTRSRTRIQRQVEEERLRKVRMQEEKLQKERLNKIAQEAIYNTESTILNTPTESTILNTPSTILNTPSTILNTPSTILNTPLSKVTSPLKTPKKSNKFKEGFSLGINNSPFPKKGAVKLNKSHKQDRYFKNSTSSTPKLKLPSPLLRVFKNNKINSESNMRPKNLFLGPLSRGPLGQGPLFIGPYHPSHLRHEVKLKNKSKNSNSNVEKIFPPLVAAAPAARAVPAARAAPAAAAAAANNTEMTLSDYEIFISNMNINTLLREFTVALRSVGFSESEIKYRLDQIQRIENITNINDKNRIIRNKLIKALKKLFKGTYDRPKRRYNVSGPGKGSPGSGKGSPGSGKGSPRFGKGSPRFGKS